MKLSSIFVAMSGLVVLASCADMGNGPDPNPPSDGPEVSYQSSIYPTLNTYCSTCHGGSGNFYVTTVDSLHTTGDHGPNVIPGDGANSNLVKKLMAAPSFGDRMPFGGPYLSPEFIDTLRMWIDQGAKDN